jgi:hypothetical protein
LSRVEGGESFSELLSNKFEEGPVTYTIPEVYVAELAIREDNIRTRVRFAFSNKPTDAVTPTEAKEYDMFLVGVNIIRECLTTCSPEEIQPLLTEKMGQGIYDPQQRGEPYVQLNFPGRLSLLFPRALRGTKNDVGNILCIEWQGRSMRFQVDRRFNYLTNGQVRALELTEVRTEDAAKYPPGFRIKEDYEELQ